MSRALYAERAAVILDEATSALDDEAESLVRTTLRAVARDHPILIVAHRLTSIITADEICVVEDGTIVERGSHEQLLALRGRYCELFVSQLRPDQLLRSLLRDGTEPVLPESDGDGCDDIAHA